MLWSSSTGLALSDRGLQFGDGLFETLLVLPTPGSKPATAWHLDAHLQRLQYGCERLGIHYPEALIQTQIHEALAQVANDCAILKLIVTAQASSQAKSARGYARGYAADQRARPNLHCSLHPASITPFDEVEPAQVRVVQTQLATQPALAGIKHLNRLEQILARQELQPTDFEGLMLNADQGVVECTSSNLYAVIEGKLCTPPLESCGVAGVMRKHLLATLGDRLSVCTVDLDSLRSAQEVFLSNSVYGVRAVGMLVGPDWSASYATAHWCSQIQANLRSDIKALVER